MFAMWSRKQKFSFNHSLHGLPFQHLGDTETRDRYTKKYADQAPEFKPGQLFPQGSDEFFIGRAGYLAGIAVLRSWTGQVIYE